MEGNRAIGPPSEHDAANLRFPMRWAILVAAGVLYGSLIPFGFQVSALSSEAHWPAALPWPPASPEDIATNLVVYIPVGLTFTWAALSCAHRGWELRWRPSRVVGCAAVSLLAGSLLSLLAEVLQMALPARQPSATDVLLNVAGAAIGTAIAVAAAPFACRTLAATREMLRSRPGTIFARTILATVVLNALASGDFVNDTAQFHESLLHAWSNPWRFNPADDLRNALADAALFAAFGYFLALSRRERGHRPSKALVASVTHAAVLAVLLECTEIFTVSGTLSPPEAATHALSAAFGVWLAIQVVDRRTRSRWLERRHLAAPTILVAVALVYELGQLLGPSLLGLAFGTGPASGRSGVVWIPFHALWHRPMIVAATYSIGTGIGFAVLTLAGVILVRRAQCLLRSYLVVGAVAFVACASEFLQAVSGRGTPDTTIPVLAALAAMVTVEFYVRLFSQQAEAVAAVSAGVRVEALR